MRVTDSIDKFGTAGLFLTALFSPCCFPLFAFVASAFGFGSFELFGGWTMWIFQAMVVISIVGIFVGYRKHKKIAPLIVALISGGLIFYAYHFYDGDHWTILLYGGMVGILGATGLNYYVSRKYIVCETCAIYNGKMVELISRINCPNCKHSKNEIMPTGNCVILYDCEKCKTILKPLPGDCCVYCSYGTRKCPSIQAGG